MKILVRVKGGPGSGNWGHAGRPGLRGGSGGVGGGIGAGGAELRTMYEKSGGKDEWGDPIPQPGSIADASKVLDGVMADDRLRKLATALAADGEVASLENFNLKGVDLVGAMYAVDPEMGGAYSDTTIGKRMNGIYVKLYEDYEQAISREGHWQKGVTMTPEREAWERDYYGKVVGGHEDGWKYAASELNKAVANILGSD